MSVQNLLAGLEMFKSGVKDFALSKALADADEKRQEIQRSTLDEKQKNIELKSLADSMVGRFQSLGMSAAGVQQATGFAERIQASETRAEEKQFQFGLAREAQAAKAKETDKEIAAKLLIAQMEANAKRPIDLTALNSTDNLINLPKEQKETVVPGIGFATSKEDATEVKNLTASSAKAIDIIDRIFTETEGMKLSSPQEFYKKSEKSKSLLNQLAGSVRVALTGPGAMSDAERQFVLDSLGNPATTQAALSDAIRNAETAKLVQIKDIMQKAALREAKARGVTPFRDKQSIFDQLDNAAEDPGNDVPSRVKLPGIPVDIPNTQSIPSRLLKFSTPIK